MAKYMSESDIIEILQEGLDEGETIEQAFDYLLESDIRDVFEMNRWDEPEFTETVIRLNDTDYKVSIEDNGCCESTNDHRIMYWKWNVTEI